GHQVAQRDAVQQGQPLQVRGERRSGPFGGAGQRGPALRSVQGRGGFGAGQHPVEGLGGGGRPLGQDPAELLGGEAGRERGAGAGLPVDDADGPGGQFPPGAGEGPGAVGIGPGGAVPQPPGGGQGDVERPVPVAEQRALGGARGGRLLRAGQGGFDGDGGAPVPGVGPLTGGQPVRNRDVAQA